MAKVKRGLAAREEEAREEKAADERERIRVLIVGGTPEARSVVAAMVEFAVSKLGAGATSSNLLSSTAVEAVMAIEVAIRDGGS